MSSVEEAVRLILLADGAVKALLVDRLFPMPSIHVKVVPFATYQLISQPEGVELDGTPDLAQARLQFNFVSDDWQEARQVLEEVRRVLLDPATRGTTPSGVVIDSISVLDRRDMGIDEATGFYRHDLDVEVIEQLSS